MHSFSKDTREKCLNYKLAHLLIAVFSVFNNMQNAGLSL